MAPSMICLTMVPSGPSGVRPVRISLPLVEPLLDGLKYFRPDDLPALAGEDLRPMSRPKLHKFARPVKASATTGQLDQPRDLAELAEVLGE